MRISDWSSDVCSSDLSCLSMKSSKRRDGSKRRARAAHASPPHFPSNSLTRWSKDRDRANIPTSNFCAPTFGCRRSEERRVGKVCGSTFRTRWPQYQTKKKLTNNKGRRQHDKSK